MINRKKAAPTPPMGWNSWDCYGAGVTEEILLRNAAFVQQHLKDYGWQPSAFICFWALWQSSGTRCGFCFC